jgi:leucyl-tRNA synthetase
LRRATHRLIEKVSEDVDHWRYNTAVASLMEFANRLQRYSSSHGPDGAAWDEAVDTVLLLLAPMTPHVTAEAWELRHGEGARLHAERWPVADPGLARVDRVTMVVQVNGKVVDRIEVDAEIDEEDARSLALGSARVLEKLEGTEPSRVIVRQPALVNLVAPKR